MTRYTASHLAEAQQLAPMLNPKAQERIARALHARELRGRMAFVQELLDAPDVADRDAVIRRCQREQEQSP